LEGGREERTARRGIWKKGEGLGKKRNYHTRRTVLELHIITCLYIGPVLEIFLAVPSVSIVHHSIHIYQVSKNSKIETKIETKIEKRKTKNQK